MGLLGALETLPFVVLSLPVGVWVARAPGGFPAIPSLSDDRICRMPDGQLLATIANGVRNMPAYAPQVPLADRWAIVAYVRALELHEIAREGAAP